MLTKPKSLQAGDKVALISLSWGGAEAFPIRYEIGKKQIAQTFGLDVVETQYAKKSAEWLENNPEARAEDLMAAFSDPEIKGIISIIGGDDSHKIIPFINLDVIGQNPKVFLGYSDTTISHFICYKAGISSFYGPAVMTSFADGGGILPYTEDMTRKTLFSNNSPLLIPSHEAEWSNSFTNWGDPQQESLRRTFFSPRAMKFSKESGKVKAPLIGGCVETLVQMIDTSIWPSPEEWANKIIFLEISEDCKNLEHLKESLSKLNKAGMFSSPKGLLFGRPSDSIREEDHDAIGKGFSDYIREHIGQNIPTVLDVAFGHNDPVFILPYGAEMVIDSENEALSLSEAAVI